MIATRGGPGSWACPRSGSSPSPPARGRCRSRSSPPRGTGANRSWSLGSIAHQDGKQFHVVGSKNPGPIEEMAASETVFSVGTRSGRRSRPSRRVSGTRTRSNAAWIRDQPRVEQLVPPRIPRGPPGRRQPACFEAASRVPPRPEHRSGRSRIRISPSPVRRPPAAPPESGGARDHADRVEPACAHAAARLAPGEKAARSLCAGETGRRRCRRSPGRRLSRAKSPEPE